MIKDHIPAVGPQRLARPRSAARASGRRTLEILMMEMPKEKKNTPGVFPSFLDMKSDTKPVMTICVAKNPVGRYFVLFFFFSSFCFVSSPLVLKLYTTILEIEGKRGPGPGAAPAFTGQLEGTGEVVARMTLRNPSRHSCQ